MAQRYTEEKFVNSLGAIVSEGFLDRKIINVDFFFVSLWLKKTEDGRQKTEVFRDADFSGKY